MAPQKISIKQTRDELSEIIEQVAIGKKSYIITKFGKPKAQITPVKKTLHKRKKRLRGLEASFGMWADREDMRDSVKWVRDLRSRWSNRYE